MILQVNKVKQKNGMNFLDKHGMIDDSLEEYLEMKIKSRESKTVSSAEIGRKTGKTTLIKNLGTRYNLPIIVSHKGVKKTNYRDYLNSVYSMEENLEGITDVNNSVVLVDEISCDNLTKLRKLGINTVGFINDKNTDEGKVYEDYIDITSVQRYEKSIVAKSNNEEFLLAADKDFHKKYSFDGGRSLLEDDYNKRNVNYRIKSVYLLDDTGKTIRRLI